VQIFDSGTQQAITSFLAFDSAFTGGVRVTLADINGDGTNDYLVGAGPGGGPNVKIFSAPIFPFWQISLLFHLLLQVGFLSLLWIKSGVV